MDSQMKRGTLEMCILYQFLEKDYYGYEIMAEMKQYFPDVKDSTFYAILRRLHAENYIDIYYGNESNGPQRKYYKITENGKIYLQNSIDSWRQLKAVIEGLGIY